MSVGTKGMRYSVNKVTIATLMVIASMWLYLVCELMYDVVLSSSEHYGTSTLLLC